MTTPVKVKERESFDTPEQAEMQVPQ